jgi:hypothetical protein
MPFYKVVFQYNQHQRGFSETFYRSGSSIQAASSIDNDLIGAALQMRGNNTILKTIRISEVSNNRRSVPIEKNQIASNIFIPDIVSSAALVRLIGVEPPASRNLWLRGLKDFETRRQYITGVDEPDGNLITAIREYMQLLAVNGFMIQSLVPMGVDPFLYRIIDNVTAVGNSGYIQVNTTAPFTLSASQRVIISQANQKDFPGLQGAFQAYAITPTSFKIQYNYHQSGVYPLKTGRFRPQQYQYSPIVASLSTFKRFTSRDTGRAFGVGRGHRSGRKIRSL